MKNTENIINLNFEKLNHTIDDISLCAKRAGEKGNKLKQKLSQNSVRSGF
jgi:hypothetical protein